MKIEWVQPYINVAGGDSIRLPGNNSCSKSLNVALGFACDHPKDNHIATLFVIACQNFFSIRGVTMNNQALTAYPSEGEVLMMEGCLMYVLAVDKGVKIDNKTNGQIAAFNG